MSSPKGSKFVGRSASLSLVLGFTGVVLLFVIGGVTTYLNVQTINLDSALVIDTHRMLRKIDSILALLKDAEMGQRSFLLTGSERYLEPYSSALNRMPLALTEMRQLAADNSEQLARLPSIEADIKIRLDELEKTIEVRRAQGFEAALAIVNTDLGRSVMERISMTLAVVADIERRLRSQRLAEMGNAFRVAVISAVTSSFVGVLLTFVVAGFAKRVMRDRARQAWLQSGHIGLANALAGDPKIKDLGDNVLRFLSDYLEAQVGAFFVRDGTNYRRVSTSGVPEGGVPEEFTVSDGLLGQAAKDRKTFLLSNLPDGYLTVGSALGKSSPRHLAVVPLKQDDRVNAVVELGFVEPVDESVIELLERVSENVGAAVRSANYRANLQDYLEETQRQTEELQAQGEELRVSNEELEEQSRALRESQERLERQQAELEATNNLLGEQNKLLEEQRDDMSRTKSALEDKTIALEQSSRYKSDFLANMSHELRTPLNSSLILAKLLADNPEGNLSDEQVKFAQTIRSSGNDLLALINDILDLSKIEAGHMVMRSERVDLSRIVEDLQTIFAPVAEEKGLEFKLEVALNCPRQLNTDIQRFEQVLKNLLSNALKFTDRGTVSLSIRPGASGRLEFAVRDTGIGIPKEQHRTIFEAFRQVDGATNRNYGGTGLGLSIARELAILLGAEINLESEPGVGSCFTVSVPEDFCSGAAPKRERVEVAVTDRNEQIRSELQRNDRSRPQPRLEPVVRRVEDDRQRLTGEGRAILVIEDDETFSRIVYDLAHELNFQCLIASTAEEGIAVAIQYRPSAVVLDVGLPDHSGLTVLDRLKQDIRTRHIPVHVVSGHDYAETALSLGAVGYMMKPVKRDQLVDAFKTLETRLEQRLRRVLIVEDDPVQLESVRALLGVHDVETVGVSSGAECLDHLKNQTFDCMVLDLSLPDASGYNLLETLSREDIYSFPPVIVYTGREISSEDEQRLRKYSKSIIIKGAKSPERLLDEVTLFLHQVVSELPPEKQIMLEKAKSRDAVLEGRRILVVEDDVRNIFAVTSILEPRGALIQIARNGREALAALEKCLENGNEKIDLVLMDIMMPEMDGITAMREIRKREEWKKLPIVALTAKAMKDDQEQCLSAGANDYLSKPLDVEKLLSLVRVWMPR